MSFVAKIVLCAVTRELGHRAVARELYAVSCELCN